MAGCFLQDIYIYPIKSLGGIRLQQAKVEERGLQYDRRWMLVDANRHFLTQRTHSIMALLEVSITTDGIAVHHKQHAVEPFTFTFSQTTGKTLQVKIWDDECLSLEVSEEANRWFSKILQLPVTLVYMPESTRRMVEDATVNQNNNKDRIVGFADAHPFLLIGQESLHDLNARLAEALPMSRFRPNLVFTGGLPYLEDRIHHFSIGNILFETAGSCERCQVTTINQESGVRGKEPLTTLAKYRTAGNKVVFGQNVLHSGQGNITAGAELKIIGWK